MQDRDRGHFGDLHSSGLVQGDAVPQSVQVLAGKEAFIPKRGILTFLQSGLCQQLVLTMTKSQILALAFFFSDCSHSLFKAFVQAVTHLTHAVHTHVSLWDFNFVLSALQEQFFEPTSDIALSIFPGLFFLSSSPLKDTYVNWQLNPLKNLF